jgi:hypothetical protein
MSDTNYMRRVILSPYRKGAGPRFRLTLIDFTWRDGRDRISYRFEELGATGPETIFEGDDFGASPLHSLDGDDTVASLLTFLTLRKGDTDSEYFDGYTARQLEFRDEHAEALQGELYSRFGER